MAKKLLTLKHPKEVPVFLRDESWVPKSMAEEYQRISEHFNIDFSSSIALLNLLPVFLYGQKHKEARKAMALQMAEVKLEQEDRVVEYVKNLKKLLVPNKNISFKNDFVLPLWRHVINVRDQFTLSEMELIEQVPHLFNRNLSISQRIKINAEINRILETVTLPNEGYLFKIGSHALGYTPLIESICLSLHDIFSKNIDKKLRDIEYPELFSISAVPLTERVKGNEIMQCTFHSNEYSADENNKLIFGAGSHACLGGPLSKFIWTEIVSQLKELNLTITKSKLHLTSSSGNYLDSGLITDPFLRSDDFVLCFSGGNS
jgi:hypothetical protein